jgi:succinoglycan biosynthesis transport protein ExoP
VEIKNYLVILRRRKWVVITMALVTMLVVVVGTWLMKPTYTATATLRIATASASSTSSDYNFADRLITTYINIATSRPLLDKVNKQLGLSKTPKVTVQQIPNSELIQVSVEDQDPNLAWGVANTLGSILISQGGEFYSGSGKTPSDVLKEQVDKAGADLNQIRANYYDHLAKNPDDIAGNQTASKAIDLQQQLYYSLLSQYQQLRSREAIQSNIVSFVETATLPTSPSKPNKVLNIALGLVVSLIGGVGLAFLFENLDTTLYTSDEIGVVSSLHPIGRIPIIAKREQRTPPLDGNSPFGEAISRLRTNLLTLIDDPPVRTLLVASSLQGEGKTMVAGNLAFALSQSGKKVILVDCDLRLPSVHKVFNLQNKIGLSDYLQGNANLDQIIQGTKWSSLHVITGGPITNRPALLLDSSLMKTLVPVLLKDYDMILFDSPAVLAVNDSSVIASWVDGALLVARLGLIRKEKLAATLEQLDNVKAKMIGMVINGDQSTNHYAYYGRR